MDPRTSEGILQLVRSQGLNPYKPLGQHFLMSPEILNHIVELLPAPRVEVLEIGPGPGGLTLALLEKGFKVLAIEVDRRWTKHLEDQLVCQFPDRLTVVEGDALAMDWASLEGCDPPAPWDVVGNLPYYITAPLLAKLAQTRLSWRTAVVMVQKEVADRLSTMPGARQTNALGVILRYNATVETVFQVDKTNFYPVPEVDSAVVRLVRKDPLPVSYEAFHWVVHAGFGHRRKMLRQALAQSLRSPFSAQQWASLLRGVGLDPTARAENLTIEEWVVLAQVFLGHTR